ncbi:hypothetical protein [Dyella nitratireducens]|uniref:Uncharacterized protein n=1 Tax=Dyella nitratireducens TaxID=1849580 RepID=A0ABQ1FZ51_9GAMM|nr:hypothetical protein [Dyella nitratireducens]GGA33735.1 hypothetical protein GCM10010981_23350 [Dyella nitratireducens]GLQ40769.1 hypothetical protein GCM10007902_06190 [Dyella nitratireducens]
MDVQTFRKIVDRTPALIGPHQASLERLYSYVGLDYQTTQQQLDTVNKALYKKVCDAFTSGHAEAWRLCRSVKADLIREHVILGTPLDPYFEVVNHLQDALRAKSDQSGDVTGDWEAAIRAARDHIEVSIWRESNHQNIYAREFAVARAGKYLKEQGYAIQLKPDFIALEEASEIALVAEIEKLVSKMGGLNIARKVFSLLSQAYDPDMQRYHIVPGISVTGGGQPHVPWGYLLQLAVKHINGTKPYLDLDAHWPRLINLVMAYAAVIDVQPYGHSAWQSFDVKGLLKFLQEQALYDSIFRFPQLRSSDVLKLCRGALSFLDDASLTPGGWSLADAFEVIGYLVDPVHDIRGPMIVAETDIRRALSHVPKDRVSTILRDVLSHPMEGPNQGFSRPIDAPTPTDSKKGADFYLKPLIRRSGGCYLLVDRSMCGWGYLEALLSALRENYDEFDNKVGLAIESFVRAELVAHGVPTTSGKYDFGGEEGECDLVAITSKTLIFMELKKKSLTRRARAGSDADLLLDLAGSLLSAQTQAGWHELRISQAGSLDLAQGQSRSHLSLDGRGIEKIGVGLSDFGSFQDRIMLKHFLEKMLNVEFNSPDPIYGARFTAMNRSLKKFRDQYSAAHRGETEVHQPFFNCWFVSVPQLLIFLDEVSGADSFRDTLWKYRHITFGTSDLYFEVSKIRSVKAAAA